MPLIESILQRLKAKADAKPRRRRTPFPPLEALEMRILLSASVLDVEFFLPPSVDVTPPDEMAVQDPPDVFNDVATFGEGGDYALPIYGTTVDGSEADSLDGGGSQDVAPVDDLGDASLKWTADNEVVVGGEYDPSLFALDGNEVAYVCTRGLNNFGTFEETSDEGTTSDWVSYSREEEILNIGNAGDLFVDDLGNVYYVSTMGLNPEQKFAESPDDGTSWDWISSGSGDEILKGDDQGVMLVDGPGSADLQRTLGDEVPGAGEYDDSLFANNGNDGFVIDTMGMNPEATTDVTSDNTVDDRTASDWTPSDGGEETLIGGNWEDRNLYPVDPVVYDFLPGDVGDGMEKGDEESGVVSPVERGVVHRDFGDPVPMMSQSGAGQPDVFEYAAADAGNSSGLETLNVGTDDAPLLSGVGNDATNGIISQSNLVGGTAPNLPVNGTGGDLMVSSSNHNEGDVRGLWLLFADANQFASSETPADQPADHQSGADGVFSNSTPVSGGESDAGHLTQQTGTDSLIARSSLDGLANTAVDEIFTHLDSHL